MPARPVPPSRPVPGTEQRFHPSADAVQDASGRLHLLVGLGPRRERDVRYLRSDDVGETWSEPLGLGRCRAFRVGLRDGLPFAALAGPDLRVHDLGAPGAPVVSQAFPEGPFADNPVGLGVGLDGSLHLAAFQPTGGLVPDPHPYSPDPSGLALSGRVVVYTRAPDPFGPWAERVPIADVPDALARFRADATDAPVVVVGEAETAVLWVGTHDEDRLATSADGQAWTVGAVTDERGAGIPAWKPGAPSSFGYTGGALWTVTPGGVVTFGPVVRHGDTFRIHRDVVVSRSRTPSHLGSAVTQGGGARVAWMDERHQWVPWYGRTELTFWLAFPFVGLESGGRNNDLFVATVEGGRKGPEVRLTPPRARAYGTLLLVDGPRPVVVWAGMLDLGYPPRNLDQPYRLYVTPLPGEVGL